MGIGLWFDVKSTGFVLYGLRSRVSMRFSDEVLDVGGSCRRSATLNAHFKSDLLKTFIGILPLWSRFWEFWANNLKSRLQFNHVPVHETHSAKVRKIITTSKIPLLNRIVKVQGLGSRSREFREFGFWFWVLGLGSVVWDLGFRA